MYKTAVPKEKPKTFRRITLDMVLNSTSLTKSSKESSESYLGRVTHLHLQGKKIRYIEGLELCTNLKVIQLSVSACTQLLCTISRLLLL